MTDLIKKLFFVVVLTIKILYNFTFTTKIYYLIAKERRGNE